MASVLLKRVSGLKPAVKWDRWLQYKNVKPSSTFLGHVRNYSVINRIHLSPLFPGNDIDSTKDCKIQLMDDETWRVASGLVDGWRSNEKGVGGKATPVFGEREDGGDYNEVVNSVALNNEDPDFDEIEDMRIRRNLFYKIDKDSKEYEEYAFEFHRRRSPKNEKNRKENKEKKKGNPSHDFDSRLEKRSTDEQRAVKRNKERKAEPLLEHDEDRYSMSRIHELGMSFVEKKQRTLTFNQRTAAYHEPFCLDIYISKGSVRASIIHRATSKVVVVAHSISKDMKFDLSSTKNRNACAAVGEALAHRALADDIHNVIYTPRKGERLEGKLQIVLKSVIDGGINVKVKLKQKKFRKARKDLPQRSPY